MSGLALIGIISSAQKTVTLKLEKFDNSVLQQSMNMVQDSPNSLINHSQFWKAFFKVSWVQKMKPDKHVQFLLIVFDSWGLRKSCT